MQYSVAYSLSVAGMLYLYSIGMRYNSVLMQSKIQLDGVWVPFDLDPPAPCTVLDYSFVNFFSWRYDTAWHINVGGLISRLQFKVLVHHWSSFCSWISTETAHSASIYELSFPCNLLAYMNWVLLLGRRARAHLRQAFIWMLFYLFLSWFISCNQARSRPGCDSIYFFFSTYLNLNPNWNGETLLAFDVSSTVGPTYRCH